VTLAAVLDALPDAVIAVAAAGDVIACNAAARALDRAHLPLARVARGERFREEAVLVEGRLHHLESIPLPEGGGVLVARDVTEDRAEVARLTEELGRQALIDELTGLSNRRGFTALAEQQLRFAQRTRRPQVVFYADLDDLKVINDAHGHEAGDRALREVAALLVAAFRRSDVVARIGGDEFAVLAIEASAAHAEIITARLAALLAARNAGADLPLSLSTGFAVYEPEDPQPLDVLLARADARMYERKRRR
jgi:diguanylate cyclase (GGDEF)-like protein